MKILNEEIEYLKYPCVFVNKKSFDNTDDLFGRTEQVEVIGVLYRQRVIADNYYGEPIVFFKNTTIYKNGTGISNGISNNIHTTTLKNFNNCFSNYILKGK
jgi:hypothetical protein